MNLFDRLVDEALRENQDLAVLRPVVEKEILHHEILRLMSEGGYLQALTFIGGTCLRDCYSSPRLSEDLDFTGGTGFDGRLLENLGGTIEETLSRKYGAHVSFNGPRRDEADTKTWKIRVDTHPDRPEVASQRIHVDVCSVSSFDTQPSMLKNRYGVELGTSGLILNVESREEILADKYLALAMRPNRVKYRDVWDIMWLNQHTVELRPSLLIKKVQERGIHPDEYLDALEKRITDLSDTHDDFLFELQRFLPRSTVENTLEKAPYWQFVVSTLGEAQRQLAADLDL